MFSDLISTRVVRELEESFRHDGAEKSLRTGIAMNLYSLCPPLVEDPTRVEESIRVNDLDREGDSAEGPIRGGVENEREKEKGDPEIPRDEEERDFSTLALFAPFAPNDTNQNPESRIQNPESRIQKSEVRSQNPEVRSQNPEVRIRNPEEYSRAELPHNERSTESKKFVSFS